MNFGGEFSWMFWKRKVRILIDWLVERRILTINNSPNDYQIPQQAAPFMGILLAALLHRGDISGFLREEPAEVLQSVAAQIREREFLTNPFLNAFDLPVLDGPSWWTSDVLPAIAKELRRRTKPKRTYSGGPIARLKQLDIVTVAENFTILEPAGAGKLKGLCPLHEEKTASFYVYQESQRWRCFGACAKGGDVIDLLARIPDRRSSNG